MPKGPVSWALQLDHNACPDPQPGRVLCCLIEEVLGKTIPGKGLPARAFWA